MSKLYHNLSPLAAAAFLGALAWMFGGTRGDVLVKTLPWMLVFVFEVFLAFPQRRHAETTADARRRAWRHYGCDPLAWLSIGFMVLLLIPFVNKGLCPICDAAAIAEGANEEPFAQFLPFCVNRLDHLNVVFWFVSAMLVMLGVKHSMTKAGKRLLVEAVVWNGVALVVFGMVQQALQATGPFFIAGSGDTYFFSTFGYANMAGDYFTVLMGLAFAVWRRRCLEVRQEDSFRDSSSQSISGSRRFWAKHYPLIAVALLYFGALTSLSRSAILLSSSIVVIFTFYTTLTHLARLRGSQRVRSGARIALSTVVIAVIASVFVPQSVRKELGTVEVTSALDRVTGKSEYHNQVALAILGEYPLFGCGGWGYRHFSVPKTPKAVSQFFKYDWSVGGVNVHNDYLQFLCEHGVVGFCAFIGMLAFLLCPVIAVWKSLAQKIRFVKPSHLPSPRSFFIFPDSAFAVLMATASTFIHAFGDCPLRSPAIMTLVFAALAAIDGYLPRIENSEHKEHQNRGQLHAQGK